MAKPSALLQALLLLAAASAEAGEDAGGLLWVDAQPAQTWASGALSASNAAAAAGVRGSARRVSESDASEAATAEASRQRCSASSGCASCTAEGTCESCVNSDFALSSGQCVYCPVRWGFNAWEGNCYYPCPSTHPIFAMGRCYGCKAGMYISSLSAGCQPCSTGCETCTGPGITPDTCSSPAIPVPTSTSAPWHGHDDDDDGHDDDDGGPGGGLSPSPSARPDSALDGASSSSGDSTLPWLGLCTPGGSALPVADRPPVSRQQTHRRIFPPDPSLTRQQGGGPTCVLCLCAPASVVLAPCGHVCICENQACAGGFARLEEAARRCPLCRVPVAHMIHGTGPKR
ncbi:hypothetical protein FNF31_06537 [Cafeteria roenbergensis]|uniref:RING-type domain-containing protein n=1 Tax=Cafeteria roenbergensis TaxID=33653 RepID=A0A5A8CKM1_CAFRO|nr:hypothetical protein FNF31_06537 [Cafeteria roenbergensis]